MLGDILKKNAVMPALIAVIAVLLWSLPASASSTAPGADCGAGTILAGNDNAGKLTMGAEGRSCTITFSAPFPNAPACSAANETNGGGFSMPLGVRTTSAGLQINSNWAWGVGDVVSYMCISY